MKPLAGLLILSLLAACGADGEPVPPKEKEEVKTGITISGSARFGVTKKL